MNGSPSEPRAALIRQLLERPLDVLIIGGGIVGAGVARDAAMRGLRVGLVEHCCANEWAVHLEDVMLRRTGWHYYGDHADRKAEQVRDWMGEILGWTLERRAEELSRYRRATDWDTGTESSASSHREQRNDQQPHSLV